MFVVVHHHHAVGGVRHRAVVEVSIPRGHAYVQLHAAGVQVGGESIQKIDEPRPRLFGDIFKVHHQAAVFVTGKKGCNLLAKDGARILIAKKSGNINPVGAVEIIDQREDVGAGVLRLEEGHDFVVHRMHHSALDHLK